MFYTTVSLFQAFRQWAFLYFAPLSALHHLNARNRLHDGEKSEVKLIVFKEHLPHYVNTVTVTHLQNGTQNTCFHGPFSSIFS